MKNDFLQFLRYSFCALFALGLSAAIPHPLSAQGRGPDPAAEAKLKEAAEKPTPKASDGHPDMTGYWDTVVAMFGFDGQPFITRDGGSAPGKALFGNTTEAAVTKGAEQSERNFDKMAATRIQYKAQYRDQVKDEMLHPEKDDPMFACQPEGVPRIGFPNEIVQTPKTVVFLYENPYDHPDHFTYRVIPTDGRPHDPDADDMPLGDSVGRWEGDTLVVDVTHLSAKTWVGGEQGPGTIHDANLHVIERFTRKGDTLEYGVTLEDPTMFDQPFVAKTQRLIVKPNQHSHEDYPCVERDRAHMLAAGKN